MSVKYAATSDQKSLMCFVNGKPSSETFLIIQKPKAMFHTGLLPVHSTFALQSHCGETSFDKNKNKKTEKMNLLLSH